MLRLLLIAFVVACGPGRTTFARYPGAPATFDKAASDPKAVEIAEKVYAAAGGGAWDKAKQIKWHQVVTADGKVTTDAIEAWDRWNARHYGRLIRTDGTKLIVGYDLYGTHEIGYVEDEKERQNNLDDGSRKEALKVARGVYNVDTAALALQFLMLEPGTKLAYVGAAKDDAGSESYDELKVTFADPLRSELEFHPIIDRATFTIQRIEIYKAGTMQKIGYTLKDWTAVGGLKFATARGNLGYAGETVAIKDIQVGDVEDSLWIAPITH